MILLDTDTLTLLFQGHARIQIHMRAAEQDGATTIITRIEILRGRFDAILKAEDGERLLHAHTRLHDSEKQLGTLPIIPIDTSATAQFDKLLKDKKLKKIGRGDLLIASIALAQQATLITRNIRDFQQVPSLTAENWAD